MRAASPESEDRPSATGIGAVLSVNDGDLCLDEDFARRGLAYACVPLSDNAPPRDGDLEHCLSRPSEGVAFAEENMGQNIPVLVHCAADPVFVPIVRPSTLNG